MLAAKGIEALGGAARFARSGFRPPNPGIPRAPNVPSLNNVVHNARNALSRFFTGSAANHSKASSSSLGAGSAWRNTAPVNLRTNLSLHARHSLSRPLTTPYHLPRVPALPQSTMQVGLGTARKFSTGRPIFQHLVENVPITGRAFWEADWDLRLREESKMHIAKEKSKGIRKSKEVSKQKDRKLRSAQDEISYYFATPTAPQTQESTTVLRVPLAPTPTNRMPLADRATSSSSVAILPFESLSKIHADHQTHRLRVSALFDRLDTANVWDRGVSINALGDPSGLCSVLEITFNGWTVEQVKSVLGEAGRTWCTFSEAKEASSMTLNPPRVDDFIMDDSCADLVFPKVEIESSTSSLADPSEAWYSESPMTASEHDPGWETDSNSSTSSWSALSTPFMSQTPLRSPPDIDTDHSWMLSADFARRAGVGEGLFY